MDYTTLSGVVNLDSTFDIDSSMIISCQEAGHAANCSLDQDWPYYHSEVYFNYSFLDSDTIIAHRRVLGGSTEDTDGTYMVVQFPFNGYYIDGYVREIQGGYNLGPADLVIRDLYLYRSDTGQLMDKTTSVSGTGYFYLETTYSGQHYIVCLDDTAGEVYNDLIWGQVYPTVISGCFAHYMGWVNDTAMSVGLPLYGP